MRGEDRETEGTWALLKRLLTPLTTLKGLPVLMGVVALILGLSLLAFDEMRGEGFTVLIVGGALILFFVVTSFQDVASAVTGRRGRYTSNTLLMLAAFIALMAVGNYLAFRNFTRFDLTSTQRFTLSPQTVQILKALPMDVNALAFVLTGDPARGAIEDFLREYGIKSGRFSYSMVDPDAEPGRARAYGVTQYGTVVFETEERRVPVLALTSEGLVSPRLEQQFTSAILQATGKELKRVYFLEGHGERSLSSFTGDGYTETLLGLAASNYQAIPLPLITDPTIPDDAAVIVIAGPKQDLNPQEADALGRYLEDGGKLLVLLDPEPPQSVVGLIKPWGVDVVNGTVVDADSPLFGSDRLTPVLPRSQYNQSDVITRTLDITLFPNAVGLAITEEARAETLKTLQGRASFLASPLFQTSQNSWAETDLSDSGFDEGVDTKGPILLGVTIIGTAPLGTPAPASSTRKTTRLVVIGDSDFASNGYIYGYVRGNSDLLLNAVSWLAEEEELIAIRPKVIQPRLFIVTSATWRWALYSSVVFLPLMVAAAGAVSWWRSR